MCQRRTDIITTYVCCLGLTTIRRKHDVVAMYVQYDKITPRFRCSNDLQYI